MRILLIVLATLLLGAGIVLGIGTVLPQNHVASRTVVLYMKPDVVWKTITNPRSFASWREDIDSIRPLPPRDGRPVWQEFGSDGSITYMRTVEEPPSRMVTRILDEDLGFGGEWEYVIAPHDSGSRLTITERGEVYDPFFRFMSRFVFGHTATIDRYLRAIGGHFAQFVEPRDAEISVGTRGPSSEP